MKAVREAPGGKLRNGLSGADLLDPRRCLPPPVPARDQHRGGHPVLNASLPGETDNGQEKSPSSMGRKRTMDGRIQNGLIGKHCIGGDKTGLIGSH